MAEISDDTFEWWVMGTPGQSCGGPGCRYVRWREDGVTGCYVETPDPEDAERFGTREEAMRGIATSLVQNDLDWDYGEIVPLKVTKSVKVSAGKERE